MKRQQHPNENPVGRMERMGPRALHGSAESPGMPNLAAAQIPGPGTGHVVRGEDYRLPDEAADPFEQQGHVPGPRWMARIFGRGDGRRRDGSR